ncbi:hypothetical protein [uncultured Clostridium sp.]|uniref:hypothetical protein n=1 Tax=uncultured Clostridium sp. TaxID=59620 RepID=UPI0028EFFA8A|nr:hypothetical protein [uncultured Clostridium sp.]
MRVLFAIGQNTSNEVQENVLKQYREKYNKSFEYKNEYYLDGVQKCLKEEEFDFLILSELLEGEAVDISVIDNITDLHPNLKVIYAIDDKHKEDEYTNRLYALAVYDGLYFNDFEIDKLIDLLNCPRTKKQAKDYYGIDEKIDDIDIKFQVTPIKEEELNITIKSLEAGLKDGNLNEVFKQVDKEYNPKEMCYLLTMLPISILNALKDSKDKTYAKYEKRIQKEVQKVETQSKVEKEIKYVEKIKEVPVERIKEVFVERIKEIPIEKVKTEIVEKEIVKVNQVRYDSIIAVISNCSDGKSYISWNLAHALSQNYNVSLVNIDNCSSANRLFDIENENAPLQDIEKNNKSVRQILDEGIPINKNLTVYTGKFGERVEFKRNMLMQLISSMRSDNNIVIIDTPTGYSTTLLSAIQLANDILFVYDMDNVHIKMNDLLLERLKEDIPKSNTVAILNNVYRDSKEYKSIFSYLRERKSFKDVVSINNCGKSTYDYMFTKTCNYLKENNEFTRDIDVLINTLKLQGKQSDYIKKKNSVFNKLLRRSR